MELGSEFSLNISDLYLKDNTVFSYLKEYNTIYLDSGRSCIKLLSDTFDLGNVLIPEYICDSVIAAFGSREIIYYKLNSNFEIDIDDISAKINENTKIFFLMHYFGSIQPLHLLKNLKELQSKMNFIIIEDTTHSFYSNVNTIGDYCVCSLRKWFALPDGGVLYSKNSLEIYHKNALSKNRDIGKIYPFILKQLFIDGKISDKSLYRELFITNEKLFDVRNCMYSISDISLFLLNCYDILSLKNQRIINYRYLESKLNTIGINSIISLSDTDCPYVLPLLVLNRDKFRKYLNQHNIYCAVHWPLDKAIHVNMRVNKLSERIISLPIDQRYGASGMDYLFSKINDYYMGE